MAKRKRPPARSNRIKGLTSYTRQSDQVTIWRWVPSPKERRLGFAAANLGDDRGKAVTEAELLNERAAAAALPVAATVARRLPRRLTLADLVHEFTCRMTDRAALDRDDADHLTAKTLRQYRTQLAWLRSWAGDDFVDTIDADVCADLRKTLIAGTSAWNVAARLRMLRQLLGFAKAQRWIRANPMDDIGIPTPRPRKKRAAIEAIEWLADFARTFRGQGGDGVTRHGGPNLELAVLLGFFTTQREGDQLAASRMNWRPVDDVDHYDRATLSLTGNGALFGLRIYQQKTRKWVTCFLPPDVAERLDALIESRGPGWDGPLLQSDEPGTAERAMPEWEFQRIYRAMRDAAVAAARAKGDNWLADQLDRLQYRDMRRSGMCWMRDMGVQVPQIAAISGHSITYTMKVLDTYMPGDPRGAAAGLATALRTRAARPKQEKKG